MIQISYISDIHDFNILIDTTDANIILSPHFDKKVNQHNYHTKISENNNNLRRLII